MRPAVSVCMASYNGSDFIAEQVDSILGELQRTDELIIIDDCSDTETIKILKNYDDPRISLIFNSKNVGHVKTFEKAILYSSNPIIILSDQDDIWISGRVDLLVENLTNSKQMLITSNFRTFTDKGTGFKVPSNTANSRTSNSNFINIIGILLGNRSYYGCTMAFNRDFIKLALPIPSGTESHDLWFAIVANIIRKNLHINDITISRRLHSKNVTINVRRPIVKKVVTRIIFVRLILIALIRKLIFRA